MPNAMACETSTRQPSVAYEETASLLRAIESFRHEFKAEFRAARVRTIVWCYLYMLLCDAALFAAIKLF